MKKLSSFLHLIMISSLAFAKSNQFINPIISGGSTDPSISTEREYFILLTQHLNTFRDCPFIAAKSRLTHSDIAAISQAPFYITMVSLLQRKTVFPVRQKHDHK